MNWVPTQKCERWRKVLFLCAILAFFSQQAYSQSCNCPDAGSCGTCTGGLIDMTLQYTGGSAALVTASDLVGVVFLGTVQPGGQFTIYGSIPNQKFVGDAVTLTVSALPNATINTSCSVQIKIGDTFGSFKVISAHSIVGMAVCCNASGEETTPPVISNCPSNISVAANAACKAVVSWTAPTASDNCTLASFVSTHNPGATFNLGTTAVTYTATDIAGNSSTCTFNVTVTDQTAPTITSCPSNINAAANSLCQAVVTWTAPTPADNCSLASFVSTHAPGSTFNQGTTTVTYTATDGAGLVATCSFTVTVADQSPPVITGCPSNITVTSNGLCQGVATWTPPTPSDNCSMASFVGTHAPGATFNLGTTAVTYTATDAAGNVSTCTFNVTVVDQTAPVITGCPSNITSATTASCQAVVTWTPPTPSDNCSVASFVSTHAPGATFNLGTTAVTYTATDAAGNTSTCTFNVIVVDQAAPVITGCPSGITLAANSSCHAVANWTPPTPSDNCSVASFVSTHAPGATFDLGTTTVTYTATDGAGLTSTCSFTVTVVDQTPPVLTGCPSNITISANASCQAVASWTPPTPSDNCEVQNLVATHAPGSTFNLGTTAVTYTVTDGAGLTATCSFNVTVVDQTVPMITGCPSNIVMAANSSCKAVASWTPPTPSDNCSIASFVTTHAPGTTFNLGTNAVTYTATDGSGNSSTCTFNVTVVDQSAPVITGCPSNITVPATASCQAVVSWTPPTPLDNCSVVSFASTHAPGAAFNIGTTSVTCTATDGAGLTATCSFNVTVVDQTAPVLTGCPSNITIPAGELCKGTASWTPPTPSDNCSIASFVTTHAPGATFNLGTTTVTYTLTDGAGNTTACSFNVTVVDQTPPVITGCLVNITTAANASCQAVVSWTPPTPSDNCSIASFVSTHSPGATFNLGTTTVTYTATDGAGNTSTCTFNVTVVDQNAPVITGCPSNITIAANSSCQAVANWTPPIATDNCSLASFISTHSPGSTFNLGTTPVTYTATDGAGNVATCTFNVTVVDQTAPLITGCPSNITVAANASCQALATWSPPTPSDNCSVASLVTTHAPGASFNLGTTAVTYTATDNSGNTSTCSFNVTVVDQTAPTIEGCPQNLTISANSSCKAVGTWTPPTPFDNCSVASFTTTHAPGSTFNLGTTTVTYTATDAAGLTATCSFTVTVVDDTAPVISGCPSNITIAANASCKAVVSWTPPTPSDNCSVASFASTHSPGATFNKGTTAVTYTATDGAGNISTCTFNVTVVDQTPPVITGCPSNITLAAGASCQAVATWIAPTPSDNCSLASFASTHAPGGTFSLGTTPVTYTATDGTGNISTCTFNVTVVDQTAPVLSGCPSDITIAGNYSCGAVVSWTPPTASDNCSIAAFESTHVPGAIFSVGTTTVTYTATDGAGQTATCSFNVTVVDDSAPVITECPSNITIAADASCQSVVNWTPPTASDNCAVVSFVSTHSPGDAFHTGTTVVSYSATDEAGNISTCSFTVSVIDQTAPEITGCPSDITIGVNGSCQAVATWTPPTASDNCSVSSFVSTHAPGATFSSGTTTVTYTASDGAGNTATCSFNVVVGDDSPPTITGCPANITLYANSSCVAPATWTVPTATDNCSVVSFVTTHAPGTSFPSGITQVTYTATDAIGNISTCSFSVSVLDDIAPVITNCPSNITIAANSTCEAIVSWTPPTALDNCAVESLVSTHSPGHAFAFGITTVTYTASDASGNNSSCTFKIEVIDQTAPVFSSCPAEVIGFTTSACKAVVDWTPPSVADNCSYSLTSSHAPGDEFAIGETLVTYTATDPSGNSSTCTFKVKVNISSIPVINDCPGDILVSSSASCNQLVSWSPPTISQNCGVTLSSDHQPGSYFPVGKTKVTYTATDQSGNQGICYFYVTVKDTDAPIIESSMTTIVSDATQDCGTVVTWTAPTISDCSATTVSTTHNPGDIFPLGKTIVTYVVRDAFGNESRLPVEIIVNDKKPPVFTSTPGDIKIPASNECTAIATWAPVTAWDNCSDVTVTSSHSSGDTFPIGKTPVTYNAKDQAGNLTSFVFNVIVESPHLPAISGCPADMTFETGENGEVTVTWSEPTASVGCGSVTLSASHRPGQIFTIGTTQVTYTATDNAGNQSICTFNVTVSFHQLQFTISQILSPDNDGANDTWLVSGIEKFKDNRVLIVDRWGSVVFDAKGYNNNAVVWNGSNKQGSSAPTGTYFYTIEVTFNNQRMQKRGFLELIR
jgi:gliding motility-associated-like protein